MIDLSVEEQLERTQKEADDLRHAMDQSSIVAFTDSKGTITYVNDNFCAISKYSREELIGQNHRIINSGHHSKEFFLELWKTISSGKVWKGEIKNKAKDGTFYWVFTTIVPFMTAKGRPFKYVAIRTDISEMKQIQEQAEHQRALLAQSEKMASVGELAAGIAHELGNPLATIAGRTEFLESRIKSGQAGQDEIFKTLETIKQLGERMASIIRGMRALSRDGTSDPVQRVNLSQLIRDVLGLAAESFVKHGIRIDASELDRNVQIECQETQISQVFVNLINNAKDAIMDLKDSKDRWIKIELLDRGDLVDVAVTDCGPGIPADLAEKIMQPFFTTKAMGKGSGLGLSVSRTIVENHLGNIVIDQKSPNTRFVVTLPKRQMRQPRSR